MAIKGPLTGARILDLTVAHAGPYGAQLLGDLGAEVIKIEPPKFGDFIRHAGPFLGDEADLMNPYALALFRNRRNIALDIGTKSGKQAFYDLVKVSDVVFSQHRAEVAKRLGIDHETLIQINPRIISCVLTGFGSSGPYVNRPSYDDIAQGVSGMASLCGEKGGKPIRAPVAIVDILTGAEAALGIASCLYEVKSTGKGRKMEISLLDTALSAMDTHLALYWLTGKTPEPQGSRHPATPLLGSFKTKDGYIIIGPCWPRICRAINREWMIDDPRFSTPTSRFENRKAMEDLIEEALQEQTTEAWAAIFEVEDIAFAPVNTVDKAMVDPQVVHNKSIITLKHPKYGEFKGVDNPIRVQGMEGEHIPPSLIGEHTEEALKGILGYSDDKIRRLNEEAEKHSVELKSHVQRVL